MAKYKIGDKVQIKKESKYGAFFGFAGSELFIKNIRKNYTDNAEFDGKTIFNLKTINGKSIEDKNNDIWVFEEFVEVIL